MSKKSAKKVNIIVTVTAIMVVAFSVLVTLYASGVLFNTHSGDSTGYQNVTFNDAVMNCHARVKDSYGKKIRTLVTDNHSSRYSDKLVLYKIFLKLDLYTKDRKSGRQHFVNCFVKAKNGRIAKFEVFEDREKSKAPVVDDGTNMFGIKRRQ